MKYSITILLVLIELSLTACGPPIVNIDPTVNLPEDPTTNPPVIPAPPAGITVLTTLTCSGINVGFRSIPAVNITFSYQEITYSDEHKQVTCSISSNVPSDNSHVSGSGSALLNKTDNDYNLGNCVAFADIDASNGRWAFTNNKRVVYSGTAQTTLGGLLDITSYCH